jgi:hypothetical protein
VDAGTGPPAVLAVLDRDELVEACRKFKACDRTRLNADRVWEEAVDREQETQFCLISEKSYKRVGGTHERREQAPGC